MRDNVRLEKVRDTLAFVSHREFRKMRPAVAWRRSGRDSWKGGWVREGQLCFSRDGAPEVSFLSYQRLPPLCMLRPGLVCSSGCAGSLLRCVGSSGYGSWVQLLRRRWDLCS